MLFFIYLSTGLGPSLTSGPPTTSNALENVKTPDQILSPNAIKGLLSAALTQQQKFPNPEAITVPGGPGGVGLPASSPVGGPRLPLPPGLAAGHNPVGLPGGPNIANLPPFLANAMANSGSLLENLTSAAMLR